MKKIILLSYFTVCIFDSAFSQNPLAKQWDKNYGGTITEVLTLLQQTDDAGYIIGGYSYSGIGGDKTQPVWGNCDFWIVKTDSLGNHQWNKDFGGTDEDFLYSLQQTNDGGYILGGISISDSSGDKTQYTWGAYDYWIVKIDSLGTKQWDKDFGGTNDDGLYCIQQTSDGGYLLGGYSNSGISGDKTQATWGFYDYWIVKIDSLGIKQWDRVFGGTSDDELYSLQQTADGGYILGGYSVSDSGGNKTQNTWGGYDYWIVKIDSLGNKQWDKDFGSTDDEDLFSVQQTFDGGYILGGWSWSGIGGDKTQASWGASDYWILKTDSLGNKQWDKDFGGINWEDQFGNISQTLDGGYLIAGTSYSDSSGDKTEDNLGLEQTWIVKTDSLGVKLWDKTIFTNGHDEQAFAIQTIDGCYVIGCQDNGSNAGYKSQIAWNNSYDYWIVKFCDTTITSLSPNSSPKDRRVVIFPNPANDFINISLPLTTQKNVTVEIYDLYGRKAFKYTFFSRSSRDQSLIKIDISEFSSGVYFIKIDVEGKEEVKKIIKI